MFRTHFTISGSRITARAATLGLALLLGLGTAAPAGAARPEAGADRPAWTAPWTQLAELLGRLFATDEEPRSHGLAAGGGMDPNGLEAGGDDGPGMDPNGLDAEGDHGPDMDPDG